MENGTERKSQGGMTRRAMIKAGGLIGFSMTMGGLLSACSNLSGGTSGGAATGGGASDAGPVEISLKGWEYRPDLVEQNLKTFMTQNPQIKVNYAPESNEKYVEKMLGYFASNSAPDVMYVYDTHMGAWAQAGYIQPIDGLPGLDQLDSNMVDASLNLTKTNGKQYGLPYYSDLIVYAYNSELLNKAGFDKPAATWDEVKQQALAMKKAKLLEYPIVYPAKTSPVLPHWWSFVIGSGGEVFTNDLQPMMDKPDGAAVRFLEWLVDAIYTYEIMDKSALETANPQARSALMAGQAAYAPLAKNDIRTINDASKSKIAGKGKAALVPSLDASGPHHTVSWTRMYALNAKTKQKDAAWKLMKYLGGPESAKKWFKDTGLGYAYKSLDNDKDIAEWTKPWGDLTLFSQAASLAKARVGVSEKWFPQWEQYNRSMIQQALLKVMTPKEAMAASAKKARDLKVNG